MTTKAKLVNTIAGAIQKADSSYFNEDYTKQARAVLDAIERAGFALTQKDFGDEIFKQAADQMRTGQLKPHEHVKDVYQVVVKLTAAK